MRAAVVLSGVEVVGAAPVAAVREGGVERRVLAEILHPAVVTVGQRLTQKPPVRLAPGPGREVELGDLETLERAVAVDVGPAAGVPRQRARRGGARVARV